MTKQILSNFDDENQNDWIWIKKRRISAFQMCNFLSFYWWSGCESRNSITLGNFKFHPLLIKRKVQEKHLNIDFKFDLLNRNFQGACL